MSTTRQPKMPEAGAIGRNLLAAVDEMLGVRKWSARRLSAELEATGRPIPPLGVARMQQATRRVDVDEAVALAVVLGVNVNALLLPRHVAGEDVIELTPKVQQRANIAWGWARGRWPLPAEAPWPEGAALYFPSTVAAEFAARTRPDFERTDPDPAVAELDALKGMVEAVTDAPDQVARWTAYRDTILRRFRLAAIQLEEMSARLDREALAAGAFTFDADAAQREIRTATGWVRGPVADPFGERKP